MTCTKGTTPKKAQKPRYTGVSANISHTEVSFIGTKGTTPKKAQKPRYTGVSANINAWGCVNLAQKVRITKPYLYIFRNIIPPRSAFARASFYFFVAWLLGNPSRKRVPPQRTRQLQNKISHAGKVSRHTTIKVI